MKTNLFALIKKTTWFIFLISMPLMGCRNADDNRITPATPDSIGENTDTGNPLVPGDENALSAVTTLPNETIPIRLLVEDNELLTYEHLVDVFEADNPDIVIDLLTASEVLRDVPANSTETEKQLALAASADVLATYTRGSAIRAGLRMDLTPFIAADNTFNPDDFYAGLLEEYQWDGKTWAIPLIAEFDLLVYNKDLFDRATVSYPATNWAWEDMLDAALALTVRENGEVVQWGFADRQLGFTLFPNMSGTLLTANTTVPQPRFEDPSLVAEVQWYTDLFVTHQVAPYPDSSFNLDSLSHINTFLSELHELVHTGKVAMWTDSSTFLTDSFIPSGANWGIAPLPGCSPTYAGTASISAGTQNPEAAWRLVRFLSQQFIVAGSLGDVPKMPARRSVAEAGGFYDEVNSELTNALRYAVEHACPMYKAYTSLGADEALSAFQVALGDILTGQKSVPIALNDAQEMAEITINELLTTQATATPIPAFTVGTATDTAVTDQPATTITFNILGGTDEVTAVQQLTRQFTAVHPGIAIDVKAVQGDGSLASNAAQATCFQSTTRFTSGELTAVLSLDPLMDADPDLAAGDFYPQALLPFMDTGQLWALPGQMDVTVVAYNKALFDSANVPYPEAGWTTADFLTITQALTLGEGENQQYGFLPGAFEATDMLDWLERLGANLLDESASPPTLMLANPSVAASMQWYTDLTTVYGIRPSFEDGIASLQNSDERRVMIENGRAAMWLDYVFSQGGQPLDVENVGYVPLPMAADGRALLSTRSISGYFISTQANAAQRQACWQWLTYLTTRPDADVGLPARISTAISSEYTQLVGAERAAAQLVAVAAGQDGTLSAPLEQENAWLFLPFSTPTNNLSAQLLTRIIVNQVPVAQALADAQEQLDTYRQCVLESSSTSVPGGQLSCWRQASAQ